MDLACPLGLRCTFYIHPEEFGEGEGVAAVVSSSTHGRNAGEMVGRSRDGDGEDFMTTTARRLD